MDAAVNVAMTLGQHIGSTRCAMSEGAHTSPATERVLDVAERLFMQNGYNSVTLRDVAEELGIRQASLYYHFPNGKEELFVAMAERVFQRHRQGIDAAIDQASVGLASQLLAVADWFESQPPVNFLAMIHADVSALSEDNARHVSELAYDAMFTPLRHVFTRAEARGETRPLHGDMMSGFFISLMDGITVSMSQQREFKRRALSQAAVDLVMHGVARVQADGQQGPVDSPGAAKPTSANDPDSQQVRAERGGREA